MTSQTELDMIWKQLSTTYQELNSCTNQAEKHRLTCLANMLRIEYRSLTSRYIQ